MSYREYNLVFSFFIYNWCWVILFWKVLGDLLKRAGVWCRQDKTILQCVASKLQSSSKYTSKYKPHTAKNLLRGGSLAFKLWIYSTPKCIQQSIHYIHVFRLSTIFKEKNIHGRQSWQKYFFCCYYLLVCWTNYLFYWREFLSKKHSCHTSEDRGK